MVGMGIFNVLTLFYSHFLFCDAQQSCSSHQKYIFCFFLIVMDDKGNLGLCVPHIYNPVEQKVMLDNFMLLVTLVC